MVVTWPEYRSFSDGEYESMGKLKEAVLAMLKGETAQARLTPATGTFTTQEKHDRFFKDLAFKRLGPMAAKMFKATIKIGKS